MNRLEVPHLGSLYRPPAQNKIKPSVKGALKRCDCEIGNLLDQHILDSEWEEIFIDLHDQIREALE